MVIGLMISKVGRGRRSGGQSQWNSL